jgi:cardiolipin synthase
MRINATFFRGFSSLLILLLLAGCATSRQRKASLHQPEPGSLTNLIAYRTGTNLLLRFPFPGKQAFAHAHWPQSPAETPGYQHQVAALTFEDQERATPRSLIRRNTRVALRDAKDWQQLIQGVFTALAPSRAGHGVVLLVENEEVVVFRDPGGKLTVVKLESKPPEVVVDRTCNDEDFSRQAIKLLQAGLKASDRNHSEFLFATGKDPAFVFIALPERLIVFLSYPADPETRPMEVPGWFTLRALHSLLFKSFILAAIKNPVTLVSRGLWHLGSAGATVIQSGSGSSGDPPPLCTGPAMDLTAWEARLDQLVSARPYQGRLDLFIDGEKFFPALIQSIAGAAHSIDVLVFIFDTDDYAVKIADLLKERSSAVRIRVLMDAMGSLFASQSPPHSPGPPNFQPPGDIESYLNAGSHIHVRASANPWLTVDHRKCIVIDNQQAYLGGMNIGREYRYEWHDMMVGLTGPIVGRLEKDFRKAWAHAGPFGDLAYAWVSTLGRMSPKKIGITNGIAIRPLRTATGKVEIYRAQLEAIQQAKRYIYIENAYFDDDTTLRALIQARRRGVDVRVVMPGENDNGIMHTSNQFMANEMVRNGIRVYAYPRMTHIKAAIYDGWACLGSANFDKMSLRISQELDVAFSDPATVGRLERELFEADFKCSRELKSPVPLDWLDSLVKTLADQL